MIIWRGAATKIRCGRVPSLCLLCSNQIYAQELQGTLLVTLRNSNQIIEDGEVRRKFQQFGDVKAIRPAAERHELAIIFLWLNHRTNAVPL